MVTASSVEGQMISTMNCGYRISTKSMRNSTETGIATQQLGDDLYGSTSL